MNAVIAAQQRVALWRKLRWISWGIWGAGLVVFAAEVIRGQTAWEWLGIPFLVAGLWLVAAIGFGLTSSRLRRAQRLVQDAQGDAAA